MAKKNKNKNNVIKVNTNVQQKPVENVQDAKQTQATQTTMPEQAAEPKPEVQVSPQAAPQPQPQTNAVPVAEPIDMDTKEIFEICGLSEEDQQEYVKLEKEGKLDEFIGLPSGNPFKEIRANYSEAEIKRALQLIHMGKTSREDIEKFSGIDTDKMLKLLAYGEFNIKGTLDIMELDNSLGNIVNIFEGLINELHESDAYKKAVVDKAKGGK